MAVELIAAGHLPLGRKRTIYAIAQPMPLEAVLALEGSRKPASRSYQRVPTPQAMTTTAEGWDNPPHVIKLRPIPSRTRLIFLSTFVGRAGILPVGERKRMRSALREA